MSNPELAPHAVMAQLIGSESPADALLYLRDLADFLNQAMAWYQLDRRPELTASGAAGLSVALTLLQRGIQEVYDAV